MTTERLRASLAERYRIERELGQGGMATVYLAEDLKHHRHVAIKVLKPEIAAAIGPERFLREIEISAGLHHPHILALYDSGDLSPVPPLRNAERGPGGEVLYYVMPFVEGESLRGRLDREKQLPSTVLVNFDDPTRQQTKYGLCTDGKVFYFTIGSPESDIWVAQLQPAR